MRLDWIIKLVYISRCRWNQMGWDQIDCSSLARLISGMGWDGCDVMCYGYSIFHILDIFLYLSPFTISIYPFHSIESKSLCSVITFSYSIETHFLTSRELRTIAQIMSNICSIMIEQPHISTLPYPVSCIYLSTQC